MDTFWATFGENWATFNSNILSHCSWHFNEKKYNFQLSFGHSIWNEKWVIRKSRYSLFPLKHPLKYLDLTDRQVAVAETRLEKAHNVICKSNGVLPQYLMTSFRTKGLKHESRGNNKWLCLSWYNDCFRGQRSAVQIQSLGKFYLLFWKDENKASEAENFRFLNKNKKIIILYSLANHKFHLVHRHLRRRRQTIGRQGRRSRAWSSLVEVKWTGG